MEAELQPVAKRYIRAISRVYSANKVRARVISGQSGARYLSIGVMLADSMKLQNALKYAPNLQMVAGVDNVISTQGLADFRGRNVGVVWYQFQLPQDHWQTYTRKDLPTNGAAVVGFSQNRQPVIFNHDEPSMAHALIAGMTGSGKTEAMKTALLSLESVYSPDEMTIYIGDPKAVKFSEFANWAALGYPIAAESDEIGDIVTLAHDELVRRKQGGLLMRESGLKRLFLVLDEAHDPSVLGNAENVRKLSHIAKLGREFGVHMIVGTQETTKEEIPFLDQLGNKFTGRVTSARASVQTTGLPGLGAQKLTGSGDFIHVGLNDPTRFQVALPTGADYAALPRAEIVKPAKLQQQEINFDALERSIEQGRPRNEILPDVAARMLFGRVSGNPATFAEINGRWGITKYHHRQHKAFVERMIKTLKELKRNG